MKLPKVMPIDPAIATLYRENEAMQQAKALRRRNKERLAAIKHYAGQSMSRDRLNQIYGRELVDVAFREDG